MRNYQHLIVSTTSSSGLWLSAIEETAELVETNNYKPEVCKDWHAPSTQF